MTTTNLYGYTNECSLNISFIYVCINFLHQTKSRNLKPEFYVCISSILIIHKLHSDQKVLGKVTIIDLNILNVKYIYM